MPIFRHILCVYHGDGRVFGGDDGGSSQSTPSLGRDLRHATMGQGRGLDLVADYSSYASTQARQ